MSNVEWVHIKHFNILGTFHHNNRSSICAKPSGAHILPFSYRPFHLFCSVYVPTVEWFNIAHRFSAHITRFTTTLSLNLRKTRSALVITFSCVSEQAATVQSIDSYLSFHRIFLSPLQAKSSAHSYCTNSLSVSLSYRKHYCFSFLLSLSYLSQRSNAPARSIDCHRYLCMLSPPLPPFPYASLTLLSLVFRAEGAKFTCQCQRALLIDHSFRLFSCATKKKEMISVCSIEIAPLPIADYFSMAICLDVSDGRSLPDLLIVLSLSVRLFMSKCQTTDRVTKKSSHSYLALVLCAYF